MTTVAGAVDRAVVSRDLDPAAGVAEPRHRGPVEERRARLAGEPPMGRVAADRVGQAGMRPGRARRVLVQPPLRPAPHDLGGVELLERDALGGHAVGVVGQRDRGVARRDRSRPPVTVTIRSPDPRLDLGPGRVGPPREPDVVGPVVREADDPAVVLRTRR